VNGHFHCFNTVHFQKPAAQKRADFLRIYKRQTERIWQTESQFFCNSIEATNV